jgi:hypothetical protein
MMPYGPLSVTGRLLADVDAADRDAAQGSATLSDRQISTALWPDSPAEKEAIRPRSALRFRLGETRNRPVARPADCRVRFKRFQWFAAPFPIHPLFLSRSPGLAASGSPRPPLKSATTGAEANENGWLGRSPFRRRSSAKLQQTKRLLSRGETTGSLAIR